MYAYTSDESFGAFLDLETVIMDKSINLSPMDIKSYMKMLLEAVDYCHKHWVLHRVSYTV